MIEVQGPDGQRYQFPDDTPDEEMRAAMAKEYPPPESTLSDVTKSAGAGLVRGATALVGMPGDVKSLLNAGLDWATGTEPPPPEQQPRLGATPTSQEVTSAVEETVTGPLHEPQTTAGKFAGKFAEYAPGALLGPGNLARRAITQGLLPATGDEIAGELTEGTAAEPYARVVGAILGAGVPGVASRAINPRRIDDPMLQQHVDTLRDAGVQPTAGKATDWKGLERLESRSGGTLDRRIGQIEDQYTSAALRSFGENNATRASSDVMDRNFTRIGNQFDTLAANAQVPLDMRLVNDLTNTVADFRSIGGVGDALEDTANLVFDLATQNGNVLRGDAYQTIRSRLGKWIRTGPPELKQAARDMQDVLDNAVERHMPQQHMDAWRETRRQYKNIIPIEDVMKGTDPKTARGKINPKRLGAALASQNERAYVRGQGDLSDLAHAGQSVLTKHAPPPAAGLNIIPGVDTAKRLAGALTGKAAMSRPMQTYLGGGAPARRAVADALAGPGATTAAAQRQALIQALMVPRKEEEIRAYFGTPPPI